MYLCDRDLEYAVRLGQLIVSPPPTEYDTTFIDLHLDKIETAKVWDADAFQAQQGRAGHEPAVLRVGTFDHEAFAQQFYLPIPEDESRPVYRNGRMVVLKPRGSLLWQTSEEVGAPEENPRYICFIDGKSSKARAGLLVHRTAPTIHAGGWGKVTLEICNLGPFHLALKEGDAIAQIVFATITSQPAGKKKARGVKVGQQSVGGQGAQPGS